jgi:LytS/YehU family sensor histidine kinase
MKSPRLQVLDYALALQLSGSHAVFNFMTAIQNKIILDDKIAALKGLSEFAKFSRLVLKLPSLSTWSLSEEWHLLEAYANMEKERFADSLYLALKPLTQTQTQLPVLLCVPFLETVLSLSSALVKGKRKITLGIEEIKGITYFKITVNGTLHNFIHPTAKEEYRKRWEMIEEKCALLGHPFFVKPGKANSNFYLAIQQTNT